MLLAALVVLNIPVYLFIGWLAFDTKSNAADSFWDTLVVIVKRIFVPRILLVLSGNDDDDGEGTFAVFAFFVACGAIVYAEHYLITRYVLS